MITEIDFKQVPDIYDRFLYIDDNIAFADNITSVNDLAPVFKIKFFALVFCIEGTIDITINDTNYRLLAHSGLMLDATSVVGNINHDKPFRCVVCAFTTQVGFDIINKRLLDALMQLRREPVINFSQDEIGLMMRYYELAIYKINHPTLNFGQETMKGILRALILDLLASLSQHLNITETDMLKQGDRLFRRFVMLLSKPDLRLRSVQEYADVLCVTPKYLTSVCRKYADKTAGEIITTSIVARITQLLLHSDKTIKEIAVELGFDNLSFFGKYVKKHLGHSPNAYRRINAYGK